MNHFKILAKYIALPLLMLLPIGLIAQPSNPNHHYFNRLSLDPVVTVKNTGHEILQGIRINYQINSNSVAAFDYTCAIAPMVSVSIVLPRTLGGNLLAFEAWLSNLSGEPIQQDAALLVGTSFLLSPVGSNETLKADAMAAPVFPAPTNTTDVKMAGAKSGMIKMGILVSAYMDDQGKFSAFASTDKGNFWIEGKWDKAAGADAGKNAVQFIDKKDADKSYRLLLAAQPVAVDAVSKYPGMNTIANTEPCDKALTATAEAYPNPFLTNLTISYTVETTALVNITITNPAGAVMAKPLQGKLQEKGSYTCAFNGAALAAGTYYCKVQMGSIEKVIKLVKN